MSWNFLHKEVEIRRPLLAVSADPWTSGHEELVRAAVERFGKVVVAVLTDPQRGYTLPLTLRITLAKEGIFRAFGPEEVEFIEPSADSIAEVVLQYKCGGVVRGARGLADLEIEERRRQCAGDLLPGLPARWAIWIPTGTDVRLISASRIRDAINNGAFLSPDVVGYRAQRALRYYLRGERVATVVSGVAGRATEICENIADYFAWGTNPIAVHIISLRDIYDLDMGRFPPWDLTEQERILFRAQQAIGKGRPSIRLFCMDGIQLPAGLPEMLGHGVLLGHADEDPHKWVDRTRGEKALCVRYKKTPQGERLTDAFGLLTTFEMP